jgi:hypothetical protein
MSRQHDFITHMQHAFADDLRVKALFLSGSFGRGTADDFSDVDLLLVADPADHAALVADWKQHVAAFEPIVHAYQPPFQPVHCVITESWLRADLSVPPADPLRGRTQDGLKPLIDRDTLYAALPARLEARPIDPARVERLTREFLRVLGLLHVGLGRGEVETIASDGCYLLRRMLIDLLTIEVNLPDPGGILHLSRVLDPARMAVLDAIPLPTRSTDSAIATNFAIARAFLPRARTLHESLGVAWPEAFELATRNRLAASMPHGIAVAF